MSDWWLILMLGGAGLFGWELRHALLTESAEFKGFRASRSDDPFGYWLVVGILAFWIAASFVAIIAWLSDQASH